MKTYLKISFEKDFLDGYYSFLTKDNLFHSLNDKPSRIYYDNKTIIVQKAWLENNNKFHRLAGYAVVWSEKEISNAYYIHGNKLSKEQWEKEKIKYEKYEDKYNM